jgi:hypothetical protein
LFQPAGTTVENMAVLTDPPASAVAVGCAVTVPPEEVAPAEPQAARSPQPNVRATANGRTRLIAETSGDSATGGGASLMSALGASPSRAVRTPPRGTIEP